MSTVGTQPGTDPADDAAAAVPVRGGASVTGSVLTPLLIAIALVLLYLYISAQDLGDTERRFLNAETLTRATIQHLALAGWSTVFVLLVAIPIGILLTRDFARRLSGPLLAIFNTGQAVPSIGVLALMAALFVGATGFLRDFFTGGIGFRPAVFALVIYAALSVVRNTMVGLQQVDPAVLEAGRGMGMTKLRVLWRIELPLAVPVILAGVRTALVINVGSATLATFVGAGGLGEIINGGIIFNRQGTVTLTGAVLAASLALLVDYLAGFVDSALRPRGL